MSLCKKYTDFHMYVSYGIDDKIVTIVWLIYRIWFPFRRRFEEQAEERQAVHEQYEGYRELDKPSRL